DVVVVAPVPDVVVAPVRDVVVVAPVFDVVALGSSLGFFAPVECWSPEASSPCAAGPLEPGSATATAPPPISRPAASTQTPAAKRKRNSPTICSQQPRDRAPAVPRLPHCRIARPSVIRESQA